MTSKPTLTVFTTTYNRAYSLPRGYEALKRQTCKDFKWIVVDDGSTDNTRELVAGWIAEGIVPIEYYWKENGGMHTGHNVAYSHIDTELNVCIDSDDYMTDNAVELIISRWHKYGDKSKYAGMIGLDIFEDGTVIGTSFPDGLHECKSYDLKRKYGVVCDKKYVYRTEIIKQYMPYPEFEGEKFTPLNYVYQQIDHKYSLLCSNDVYCVVEYMTDGSTINIFRQYKMNPRGFAYERKVMMVVSPYLIDRIRYAVHYVSSSMFIKNWRFIQESPQKLLTILAIPLGVLLNVYIRYRNWFTNKK
jgi:glycosyltransferase involved in cell wall biosynthesis